MERTADRCALYFEMISALQPRATLALVSGRSSLFSLDVKVLLPLFLLTLSSYTAVAAPLNLGLLADYYHDCPASRGPQAAYLQSMIRRALRGDEAGMRSVIMHRGIFSTGDNEGYGDVPTALLRTLGDVRYAAFVTSQSPEVRDAALGLLPARTQDFARTYPKTAKLYHTWIASQRHTSNQTLGPTAGRRTERLKDEL
jgi:hypothetical protein